MSDTPQSGPPSPAKPKPKPRPRPRPSQEDISSSVPGDNQRDAPPPLPKKSPPLMRKLNSVSQGKPDRKSPKFFQKAPKPSVPRRNKQEPASAEPRVNADGSKSPPLPPKPSALRPAPASRPGQESADARTGPSQPPVVAPRARQAQQPPPSQSADESDDMPPPVPERSVPRAPQLPPRSSTRMSCASSASTVRGRGGTEARRRPKMRAPANLPPRPRRAAPPAPGSDAIPEDPGVEAESEADMLPRANYDEIIPDDLRQAATWFAAASEDGLAAAAAVQHGARKASISPDGYLAPDPTAPQAYEEMKRSSVSQVAGLRGLTGESSTDETEDGMKMLAAPQDDANVSNSTATDEPPASATSTSSHYMNFTEKEDSEIAATAGAEATASQSEMDDAGQADATEQKQPADDDADETNRADHTKQTQGGETTGNDHMYDSMLEEPPEDPSVQLEEDVQPAQGSHDDESQAEQDSVERHAGEQNVQPTDDQALDTSQQHEQQHVATSAGQSPPSSPEKAKKKGSGLFSRMFAKPKRRESDVDNSALLEILQSVRPFPVSIGTARVSNVVGPEEAALCHPFLPITRGQELQIIDMQPAVGGVWVCQAADETVGLVSTKFIETDPNSIREIHERIPKPRRLSRTAEGLPLAMRGAVGITAVAGSKRVRKTSEEVKLASSEPEATAAEAAARPPAPPPPYDPYADQEAGPLYEAVSDMEEGLETVDVAPVADDSSAIYDAPELETNEDEPEDAVYEAMEAQSDAVPIARAQEQMAGYEALTGVNVPAHKEMPPPTKDEPSEPIYQNDEDEDDKEETESVDAKNVTSRPARPPTVPRRVVPTEADIDSNASGGPQSQEAGEGTTLAQTRRKHAYEEISMPYELEGGQEDATKTEGGSEKTATGAPRLPPPRPPKSNLRYSDADSLYEAPPE